MFRENKTSPLLKTPEKDFHSPWNKSQTCLVLINVNRFLQKRSIRVPLYLISQKGISCRKKILKIHLTKKYIWDWNLRMTNVCTVGLFSLFENALAQWVKIEKSIDLHRLLPHQTEVAEKINFLVEFFLDIILCCWKKLTFWSFKASIMYKECVWNTEIKYILMVHYILSLKFEYLYDTWMNPSIVWLLIVLNLTLHLWWIVVISINYFFM